MSDLRIKDLAKQRHVSMAELAKACGYNRTSSLSQAMQRGLRIQHLEAIAHRLGVSVPDLFQSDTTTLQCPHCGKTITIKTEKI